MDEQNVIGQNPRLFTVEIRKTGDLKPVGTGFIVSNLGVIVTCRHVLRDAGMNPDTGYDMLDFWDILLCRYYQKIGKVDIYIPSASEHLFYREGQVYQAVFKATAPHPFGDDVALLQLETVPENLTLREIAVIGRADGSEGNKFYAFGYRNPKNANGLPADGCILGPEGLDSKQKYSLSEEEDSSELIKPRIALECYQIRGGMSGSAVLDIEKNLVVGIIQSEYNREIEEKHLGFAVDADVLASSKSGFCILIHKELPRQPLYLIDNINIKVDDFLAKNSGDFLNGALKVGEEWVERVQLSERLNSDWADNQVRVVALVGFGGSGKSSLARKCLETLIPKPDAVFWWNWNLRPNADEFFEIAVRHFTDDRIDLSDYTSSILRARLLARLLEGRRYLFVFDGLESMQYQSGDRYGSLKNEPLAEFLRFCTSRNHQSFCLITSRTAVVGLEYINTFRWYEVDRLSHVEGKALLYKFNRPVKKRVRLP